MGYYEIEGGKLLLAEPFMYEKSFKRGVVMICEHVHEEGTLGFILNKPLDVYVDELVEDFPRIDAPVFYGGPVATNSLHFLHNVGDMVDGSQEIAQGVYWGGDYDKLKFLINAELIKSQNVRFFVGYSGWSAGQLKEEMLMGSWITADGHPNYLFKSKPTQLWRQVMFNKGEHYTVLAGMPDPINMN